jgi:hypothetical protein
VWAVGACIAIELFYWTYCVVVLLTAFYCAFKKTHLNGHVPVGVPDLAVILNKYLNNSA